MSSFINLENLQSDLNKKTEDIKEQESKKELEKQRKLLFTHLSMKKKDKIDKVGDKTCYQLIPLSYTDKYTNQRFPFCMMEGCTSISIKSDDNEGFRYFNIPTIKSVESYESKTEFQKIFDDNCKNLLSIINDIIFDIRLFYPRFQINNDIEKRLSNKFKTDFMKKCSINYVGKSIYMPCIYLSTNTEPLSGKGRIITENGYFTFLIIEKSELYKNFIENMHGFITKYNSDFEKLFEGKTIFEISVDKAGRSPKGDDLDKIRLFPDSIIKFDISKLISENYKINFEEEKSKCTIDPINDSLFFGFDNLRDYNNLIIYRNYLLEAASWLIISDCDFSPKESYAELLENYLPKKTIYNLNNNVDNLNQDDKNSMVSNTFEDKDKKDELPF